jgi:glycosyltransferase involved in cell wall biosynthesis
MKDIYIYGAGHYGLLTAFDFEKKGVKIKGFIDKDASQIKTRLGLPVFELNEAIVDKSKDFQIVIAIQHEASIKEIIEKLQAFGLKENEDFNISHILYESKSQLELKIDNLTSYDIDSKKETKNPIVRVFVITYNNVKFTRNCLNGILMQRTDFPFEIYIYDDCSTDGTSDIIREYAGKYSNIIYDIQQENCYSKDKKLWLKKIVKNMKEHSCKYVANMDGDDYWTDPYKLQIQVDFLESHNNFSMCSGGFLINDNFNGKQTMQLLNHPNPIGFEYDFSTILSGIGGLAKNSTRACRTDAIPRYEITQKYNIITDATIVYYVLQKGKGYYFKRIFGNYNIHAGGIFCGLNFNEQRNFTYKVYENIYRETRDCKIKNFFILCSQNYVNFCLKNEEQRTNFYKEFIKDFPELSVDIENILFQRKLSEKSH